MDKNPRSVSRPERFSIVFAGLPRSSTALSAWPSASAALAVHHRQAGLIAEGSYRECFSAIWDSLRLDET
jgi:hypothetical protein